MNTSSEYIILKTAVNKVSRKFIHPELALVQVPYQ